MKTNKSSKYEEFYGTLDKLEEDKTNSFEARSKKNLNNFKLTIKEKPDLVIIVNPYMAKLIKNDAGKYGLITIFEGKLERFMTSN